MRLVVALASACVTDAPCTEEAAPSLHRGGDAHAVGPSHDLAFRRIIRQFLKISPEGVQ